MPVAKSSNQATSTTGELHCVPYAMKRSRSMVMKLTAAISYVLLSTSSASVANVNCNKMWGLKRSTGGDRGAEFAGWWRGLTSLRGGGKGKGKGKGKGRAKEDSGVPDEPQMSSTERQHAGEDEFEQDSNSGVDADDACLEDDVDDDGMLDVMASFRGERKKDCKFIIVTGE